MISSYLERALQYLGDDALTEQAVHLHIAPLFSQVLSRDEIYLANHSLGRPLDQAMHDVAEGLSLWQHRMDDAWESWLTEQQHYRARIASLIGAPRADCVVPKTSAGQGLRAVLNSYREPIRVVTTRGEFDSIDFILKQYQAMGRIALHYVEPNTAGDYDIEALIAAITPGTDLVVVSQVMFTTAQILANLEHVIRHGHDVGARVLVDVYHAVGVIPVDVGHLACDFAIGGSYKYLRGGPGACWLYVSPHSIGQGLTTLDTGWFAKAEPFAYERPDPLRFGAGGDAWLESTPPVLTYYQSRSGQEFLAAIGVERLRAYSLGQLQRLKQALAAHGIASQGADHRHGAFLSVHHPRAPEIARGLKALGVNIDARGERLRLCPDLLNTDAELTTAADKLAGLLKGA